MLWCSDEHAEDFVLQKKVLVYEDATDNHLRTAAGRNVAREWYSYNVSSNHLDQNGANA